MSGDDLDLRPMTAADLPAVLELLRAAMGEEKVPITEALWRWKHETNPFGRSPCLVAETSTNEVVGIRAFMRWDWSLGDATVRTVRAVDTATHPRWQGRGVFSRLTRALLERVEAEGTAFVFNTPNRSSLPGYLKLGWQRVGQPPLWIRPCPLAPLRRALGGMSAGSRLAPVNELLDDPRFSSLLTRSNAHLSARFRTPRTASYLRWRYADGPLWRYHGAADVEPDGTGAAVIYRMARRGRWREVLVSELFLSSQSGSVVRAARLLARTAHAAQSDYVVAVASGRRRDALALGLAGFLPVPRRAGPVVTVRLLAGAPRRPSPLTPTSWSWSVGDLEVF